ncbi:MAG: MFS transporter [Candidatus Niameybacter stercoravium]|nr:MFS transporter [Candidatus Niameybacter stercoravium]
MNKDKKVYAYFIWFVAACIYVMVFFHRVATGAVKEELFLAYGLNESNEAGSLFALLGAMYMYAYMFMQIPTGILADTLGPRKTITLGSLTAAVGSLVFAFSTHLYIGYASRFIVGMGVAVVFVCILKIIADWFPEEKFSTMSGLTSFIGNLGAILAMSPLALLSGLVGWRCAFVMMSGITFLLGLIGWFVIKEKQVIDKSKANNKEAWWKLWRVLKEIIKDRALYPIMIAFAITFGSTMALTSTWGITMFQDLYPHITKTDAAYAMSIITLGVAIGGVLIGNLADTLKSEKRPMVLFGGIQLSCWLLVAFVPMSWGLICIVFFFLGLSATSFIVSWAYAKKRHPKEYSGVTMSVVNFSGFLGGALVPQIVGVVYDLMPKDNMQLLWQVALVTLVGLNLVAFICLLIIPKEN